MPVSKRFLDPLDRSSEVLFGLIMVLTFTGSLSAAEAGRTEIRAMLIGALGCNFAWGIIDGILYLMGCWAEEGRMLLSWKQVRASGTAEEAHRIIAGAMPPKIASALSTPEFENIRKELIKSPEPPSRVRLGKEEYTGALGVFLWVFVVTLPVAVPFLVMDNTMRALRVSNGIAILMLFFAGYSLGRHTGYPPWRIGLAMVGIGIVLVGITIALGGMNDRRMIPRLVLLTILATAASSAQEGQGMSDEDSTGNWQVNASLYQYIVPENPNFLVGLFMADQDMMHLEARYNYEAYKSVSLNYGANFHIGESARFDVTPMIGVYFGVSSGVTFGYRLSFEHGRFGLYSEGEYAVPRLKSEENYFYNWSELSYSATEWLRAGFVVQRTRIYDTGLDLQRGLLAGISKGDFEGTVYILNWGWTTPTWVFNAAYSF